MSDSRIQKTLNPVSQVSDLDFAATVGKKGAEIVLVAAESVVGAVATTIETAVVSAKKISERGKDVKRVINQCFFQGDVSVLNENLIRQRVQEINLEQFNTLVKLYNAQKTSFFSSSPSKETLTAIYNASLAESDKDRAKIVLDYLYNEKSSGRTFHEVVRRYLVEDILKLKSKPLEVKNIEFKKDEASKRTEYKS